MGFFDRKSTTNTNVTDNSLNTQSGDVIGSGGTKNYSTSESYANSGNTTTTTNTLDGGAVAAGIATAQQSIAGMNTFGTSAINAVTAVATGAMNNVLKATDNSNAVVTKTTADAFKLVGESRSEAIQATTNAFQQSLGFTNSAVEKMVTANANSTKTLQEAIGQVGNIVSKSASEGNALAANMMGQVRQAYETARDQQNTAQISDLRIMVIGLGVVAGLFVLSRFAKG